MANFSDILNKSADTIERPRPMPVGTYACVVQGLPEYAIRNTKNGDSQTVAYKIKPLIPQPDVDQSQLAEFGGVGAAPVQTLTFWLGTNDDEIDKNFYRVKDFVEHCGMPVTGVTRKQMLESVANAQVGIVVKHRPAPDGSAVYTEIARTLKL